MSEKTLNLIDFNDHLVGLVSIDLSEKKEVKGAVINVMNTMGFKSVVDYIRTLPGHHKGEKIIYGSDYRNAFCKSGSDKLKHKFFIDINDNCRVDEEYYIDVCIEIEDFITKEKDILDRGIMFLTNLPIEKHTLKNMTKVEILRRLWYCIDWKEEWLNYRGAPSNSNVKEESIEEPKRKDYSARRRSFFEDAFGLQVAFFIESVILIVCDWGIKYANTAGNLLTSKVLDCCSMLSIAMFILYIAWYVTHLD